MEVVASLSQGCTAAAQCGLFTYKSVPVIFEPPYTNPVLGGQRQYVLVDVIVLICLILFQEVSTVSAVCHQFHSTNGAVP